VPRKKKGSGHVKEGGGAHVKFVCKMFTKVAIVNPVRPLFISITQDGKMKGYTKKKAAHSCVRMFISLNILSTLTFLLSHSELWQGRVAGVTRYSTDNIVKRESCSFDFVRIDLVSGQNVQSPRGPKRKRLFFFCCNCSSKLFAETGDPHCTPLVIDMLMTHPPSSSGLCQVEKDRNAKMFFA